MRVPSPTPPLRLLALALVLSGATGLLGAQEEDEPYAPQVLSSRGEGEAAIRAQLSAVGRSVTDVRPVEPSLEDVFVSLIRAEGGAPVA